MKSLRTYKTGHREAEKKVIYEATVMLRLNSRLGLLLLVVIQSKVAPFLNYYAVSWNR